MFTGIITAVGKVAEINGGIHTFTCPDGWLAATAVGDSIAVNGACLTVTARSDHAFSADLSVETRRRCAPLIAGAAINLEQALAVGDKLGGHFVTGHIDGCAVLTAIDDGDDGGKQLRLSPPLEVLPLIAEKGSVALAGVSLTVNRIEAEEVELYLIPHTVQQTNFVTAVVGQQVNLEVDILARHLARLAQYRHL